MVLNRFLLIGLLCSAFQPALFGATSVPSTPSFSTGTGTYYAPPKVTISEATSGAVVHYTTNGTTPTTASTVYSGPLTISSTTTLKAVAVYPGGSTSAVGAATYTLTSPATPVIGLPSGTYKTSVSVSISEATSGAVIHYTADGTTPCTSSSVYSGPLTLSNSSTFSSTTTLKVIAVYPGGSASPVAAASYVISGSIPVINANTSASFFGMDVNGLRYGTPWPLVPVGTLRLWDTMTLWSDLNPSFGTYNWSNLDTQIDLAKANNAQVLYTFGGTPTWAIPSNVRIASIGRSASVVTVTTEAPHGLYYTPTYLPSEQSSITILGVSDSSFDGTFSLTGTPTSTTLTFAQTGSNSTSSSGSLSAVCGGPYLSENGCAEAPATLADWDEFVTALINHIGPGVVQYWELWNEANIGTTWRGDPKMLVSMAADAKRIIKSVDPSAIILSPSTTIDFETPYECANYDLRCGSTWLNNWLAAGGSSSIDAVAFHGYPDYGEDPEQIQGVIKLQQLAMNQNGLGSLPLWDTEASWGSIADLPAQSDQIAWLGRHFLLENSMGLQRSFWYAYDSDAWGGMWTQSSGLNPVGEAYQQVAKWITGATLTAPCAALASDPTTYTCAFSRANGYSALAVWNTAGQKSITTSTSYVQSRDLYGVERPVSGGSVVISTSPILLETSNAY